MAKWEEEGGRMSVSQIDVSMNAPIRHQRPSILGKKGGKKRKRKKKITINTTWTTVRGQKVTAA